MTLHIPQHSNRSTHSTGSAGAPVQDHDVLVEVDKGGPREEARKVGLRTTVVPVVLEGVLWAGDGADVEEAGGDHAGRVLKQVRVNVVAVLAEEHLVDPDPPTRPPPPSASPRGPHTPLQLHACGGEETGRGTHSRRRRPCRPGIRSGSGIGDDAAGAMGGRRRSGVAKGHCRRHRGAGLHACVGCIREYHGVDGICGGVRPGDATAPRTEVILDWRPLACVLACVGPNLHGALGHTMRYRLWHAVHS